MQALFNGIPAPLTYVSTSQINAVVPYGIIGLINPSAQINFQGQLSNSFALQSAPTVPALFTLNASGTGPGAILNQDGTVNTPANPAAKGSYIVLYATGEGQTTPPGVTGKITAVSATLPLTPQPLLPVGVTIGGQSAPVAFYGEAPGIVSGVLQINVQIPATIVPGNAVPVVLSIGGVNSNTVTMAIQSLVGSNPQPSVTALSPSSAQSGSGPLTLTITGSAFVPSSAVTLNGNPHQAAFVSASQLTIMLTASDLSTVGILAVVVTNPSPGGGASNAINFTITGPIPSLAGAWQGTWASSSNAPGCAAGNACSGMLSASLAQTGTTVTGTISFVGSPCALGVAKSSLAGPFSGTISGSTLSGSGVAGLTGTINPTGFLGGPSISGTYTACTDTGTFSIGRVP